MYNILVCDDEMDIVSALEIYLTGEGYHVFTCSNGSDAVEILHKEDIQLILLDIMMPVMDGLKTIGEIRKFSNVPVIFLSAKSEDTDKILGLNLGADDYITKPFNPVELQARVRSHIRRYVQLGSVPDAGSDSQSHYVCGGIEMDDRAKTVTLDGEPVQLTKTEYEILKLFLMNTGVVMSPREIYAKVWKENITGPENTVIVHIRHLREKLEYDPSNPRYLKVVWGHGYIMEKNC
ncbi:MAG: response regulator transcription factor [Lachnospiraceae bacterium]|nr:response regulator transcription factor [Lachnospiraceae bacterium]